MKDHAASGAVASPLRTLFALGATGTMGDGDLLRRYLGGQAEEAECAFAALVERHGPMVRHVCLAILGDDHDASDAFQATFLVLARRAGSIRDAESVGPWLFGVARRVSLRARSDTSRRRRAERSKAERDAPRPVAPTTPLPDDWAPLYQELDRLPRRYRDPLILCYLEGHSHDQAAALLGCPPGTLRTRLTRAKDRLRARLTRRGLAPTPILAPLAAAVSPPALLPLPAGWAAAAARLALAARGLPLASLSVPLAVSTLRSMTMIALARSIALGSVAVLGLGAGLAGLSASGDGPTAPPRGELATPAPIPGVVDLQEPDLDPNPPIAASADRSPGPNAVDGRSEVEGTVIFLREPGTPVTEGQLVAELDPALLKDGLANQQITTELAHADFQNAIKTREIGEINVRAYIEGTFIQQEIAAVGEVDLARAELDLARLRLEVAQASHARLNFANQVKTHEQRDADTVAVEEARVGVLRAELNLKMAEKAVELLREYEFERQIKTLEATVERAKADELAKQSRFRLEKEEEERIRRMIEKCKVYAPASGILRHPEGIAEGSSVSERQLLFWIDRPDAEEHQVDEAEVEIEAGSKQSEIAEVRQQMQALLAELRTRFSRDVPLTEDERGSYRLRYEHALDQFKAALGRPDFPGMDFETFLERFGPRGTPDR